VRILNPDNQFTKTGVRSAAAALVIVSLIPQNMRPRNGAAAINKVEQFWQSFF
jgi:hypothetical protein